ncbi:disulfide bond formation protein B [Lacisediminimonas sp.]|uniref:disulfide bond formation protein B n=1 Tax=Lacisediminimonas sp. TaxID=3060582 RepID=UPI002727EF6C|nr:disulfide bond formation protein B [Lacisediminimonas sp.]MDO8300103.1 disulfide bond formation protein B [Lacisediminimonas sp.]
MTSTKPLLIAIALACIGLLGFALYLQFGRDMLPCPLCILQRYAFAGVALLCLVAALLPAAARRFGIGLAALAALAGVGVALRHLWIKAHPLTSCGIDPLETSLNTIPTAKLLPWLFQADGLCTTEYDAILGLSIPQWSLAWLSLFVVALVWLLLRRR